MNISVYNNLAAMNAKNHYNINVRNKAKAVEKLSSGYRINRAADDAVGLSISEKMRAQIRALNQGTKNVEDGISWVQVGDGALGEVDAILHRMRELAVQALNDTNCEEERAACQVEFDQLQSEIDKIASGTKFNRKDIFMQHELPYYQCEGNVQWEQSQHHVVGSDSNELIIQYRTALSDTPKEVSITVPPGIYTTQELIDEMEDATIAQGLDTQGIMFEYTQDGTCNLNLENGAMIDCVGGGLSYLLYDMYEGGGFGALVGTTKFANEYVELEISSENNTISFDIESYDGNSSNQTITIPNGWYTRQELIDYLNNQLSGTDVTATAYGTGIKLAGKNSIVTGFKGNMFKIDEESKIYHSVFYDNVKYGTIKMSAASFTGGTVKPTGADNEEHWNYVIDTTNQELTIQANGANAPVTLTIPEGEYTVEQMVSQLNQLFNDNNLELDATVYTEGSYKGIKITSQIKGVTSGIDIDSSSSAYDTLFVNRVYNVYGTTATQSRETVDNRNASVLGAKEFADTELPVTIIADTSDKFALTIDGASYTITLDAGVYSSVSDIVNQLNEKLSGSSALTGYKDQVVASLAGNRIKLSAAVGTGIVNLQVDAVSGNTGYTDLFVKKAVSYTYNAVTGTGTSTTKPTITLSETVSDLTTVDSSNNTLDITLNGTKHTVTLPTGALAQDQIVAAIESQIPEITETKNIIFQDVSATGSSSDRNFSKANSGKTTVTTGAYNETGSSKEIEGAVGYYEYNNPATVTISQAVPSSIEITDDCNQLQITINGETKSLTLTNGTYSTSALVNEVQKQIDIAFGTAYGGAVVSLDSSGKMVLTARLNGEGGIEKAGGVTNISCSTSTSSFLKKLHTTETAAEITSGVALQSSITIADNSNTFVFDYTDETGKKSVAVTLSNGTYTRSGLVEELNKQLKAGGYDVTASLNGNYLKLATQDKGSDCSIQYKSASGGTSAEALFGDLTKETAASATANQDIQSSITIDETSDIFQMSANGTAYTLHLDHGTYTRSDFVDMLNQKFAKENAGLTATLSEKRITYTTDKVGSTANFSITYAGGGTSMKAIYGETTVIHPGVDARFTQDGKLVLTGTQNGGSISVTPTVDSLFLQPTEKVTTTAPSTITGYTSVKHSYIDGVNIQEPLTIDNWNNDLTFTYYENGSSTSVSLSVPEKDYTFADMQTYLQNTLDNNVGIGKLTVTAGTSGIRIETVGTGSQCYMTGFSGDFYKKVLCSCTETLVKRNTSKTDGTQTNDLTYTIGRKDIRNNATVIRGGINDTLTLDFTYGGVTQELSMTLDAGTYSGDALVQELQKKLDEQLRLAGLVAGTIEVQIGGVNSGVTGSNDNNALVFKLSQSARLPAEGQYIIDGVSGNAAFSIFYQTEGELAPAYITGTKDVSEGVTIKPGETELSIKVDDVSYSVQIAAGTYTAEELLNELNVQLSAAGVPIVAEQQNNNVRLLYKSMGQHRISDVSGGAKDEIFFQENGESGASTGIKIQVSGESNDYVEIDRPIVNTLYLKINSIVITQPKYANKALDRLDYAVRRVSEIRSSFGSMQNRLEHLVDSNNNTSGNLQESESKIRDADMAGEMVKNMKYDILQQVSQAMMAQANKDAESVLQLLEG